MWGRVAQSDRDHQWLVVLQRLNPLLATTVCRDVPLFLRGTEPGGLQVLPFLTRSHFQYILTIGQLPAGISCFGQLTPENGVLQAEDLVGPSCLRGELFPLTFLDVEAWT